MMLVIVWAFTFSGLRFYPALAASVLLLGAYTLVLGALYMGNAKWLYTDLSNCLTMSTLVGFAGYLIEWQRRVLFYQHRVIDRERLSHKQLAHYDQLTGLPNRLLFEQRLAEVMMYRERRGDSFAVVFLDVDRFKPINDSFGHEAGDRALRVLASRLQSCVRQRDMVARMGDEFLILIEDVHQPDDVAAVAQKILMAVVRPMNVYGETEMPKLVCVGASIGIALYPKDGRDMKELMRAADTAMYAAKTQGRNGYRFFADSSELTDN
jgi:diguanylate cyclase (GGDEF)-like protein